MSTLILKAPSSKDNNSPAVNDPVIERFTKLLKKKITLNIPLMKFEQEILDTTE